MPFSDYTLNVYQGCAFACSYCYVPAMRARRGQIDDKSWGDWVQVKVNAAEVLREQMLHIEPDAKIAIGTATDSWQPVEKRYAIARNCLEQLAWHPNPVSLLTRSPLLLRDIDVLQEIYDVKIGVSLPTFDEGTRRIFEPNAPAIMGRLNLIKELVKAGFRVSLFWCPILYGVNDNREAIREYISKASDLGVHRLIYDTLGYKDFLWNAHLELLQNFRDYAPNQSSSLSNTAITDEINRWADYYSLSVPKKDIGTLPLSISV